MGLEELSDDPAPPTVKSILLRKDDVASGFRTFGVVRRVARILHGIRVGKSFFGIDKTIPVRVRIERQGGSEWVVTRYRSDPVPGEWVPVAVGRDVGVVRFCRRRGDARR